jgi:peptide chain release factor
MFDAPPDLAARMAALQIDEQELEEQFTRGTGPGGQKINKTSSTVWLTHQPSGLQVRCQDSRSRETNRARAREILCEKLEEMARLLALDQAARRARRRAQNRRPSRAAKARLKEAKTRRSLTKRLRQRPG